MTHSSKQETFKRILSGYYTSYEMLEISLWELMRERCSWSLTLSAVDGSPHAFKMVPGTWFIRQAYENGPEWHEDIKKCAKELGLL